MLVVVIIIFRDLYSMSYNSRDNGLSDFVA